jgi:hypothetical protein
MNGTSAKHITFSYFSTSQKVSKNELHSWKFNVIISFKLRRKFIEKHKLSQITEVTETYTELMLL